MTTELSSAPVAAAEANSLRKLAARILATHHVVVRRDLPALAEKAQTLAKIEAGNIPELKPIAHLVPQLLEELLNHLAKEEQVLFPYIEQLEAALESGAALPHACFSTVGQPIAMMHYEHDASTVVLAHLEKLTHGYTAPANSAADVVELYAGLKAFTEDLKEHIRVENEELFPGAVELEARATRS